MEATGRDPAGGDGHRIDMSLLPLKKRASNDRNGGHGSSSSPDDSNPSPPPKKRRLDGDVGAESNKDAETRDEAPALVPRHDPPPVPVATASLEPAAITEALSSTAKWLKKGKWVPTAKQASLVAAPQPPPEKKLMHDGIRSFTQLNERRQAAAQALATAAAATDDDEAKNHQIIAALPRPRPPPRPRDDDGGRVYADGGLGEVLRRRLADLGATRPWFVYKKPLMMSDVCPNQNRLLVSCKRETLERCPITPCFLPRERQRVENKDAGLFVTALDRNGVPHQLTCKFLDSNGGYRFISGWNAFLSQNGIVLDSRGTWRRDVDVELRAFRSRALPLQPQLDARGKPIKKEINKDSKKEIKKDSKKETVEEKVEDEYVRVSDHFHPDGALGLILLHHEHRRRRAEHEEEEEEEEEEDDDDDDYDKGMAQPPPVARDKGKKQCDKRDEAAVSSSSATSGEAGPAESMSIVEMADKYGDSTSKAMIGLIMLRGANSKEKQDNVVEGGDMSKERKDDNDDVEGGHCA